MSRTQISAGLFAAALTLSLGLPAAAQAGDTTITGHAAAPVRTVEIDTSNYDLTDSGGIAALEARINRAARTVCDVTSNRAPLSDKMAGRACYTEAKTNALVQMEKLQEGDTRLASAVIVRKVATN